MLNNENMWTQGEKHYTLGARGETAGGGEGGREGGITCGEVPDIVYT